MENLIVSVNCVIPMFLTLCTGLLIRLSKVVPEGMFDQLSSLSFHALLPCLLFSNIYSTDLSTAIQPDLLLYLALWLLGFWGRRGAAEELLATRVPHSQTPGSLVIPACRDHAGAPPAAEPACHGVPIIHLHRGRGALPALRARPVRTSW